mgnify:FL=1|tara:strand:- start:7814 stop:7975 length:162 start_codon:yes stop_codon:yes gene_type:complete
MRKDNKSRDLFNKKMKILFELANLEAAKSLQNGFDKKSNLMLLYKEFIKEQMG